MEYTGHCFEESAVFDKTTAVPSDGPVAKSAHEGRCPILLQSRHQTVLQFGGMDTADWYQHFAMQEARGSSLCYEQWASGIAEDQELLALVDQLPNRNRQPNLVLAASRLAGIRPAPFEGFREQFMALWPEIRAIALEHRTQTNEVGRCAVLVPLLASLPQPLALLEVGASAGLCLYPDKFSYQYGEADRIDPNDGPSTAILQCATTGPVPRPLKLPEIAWRTGIDLNPLDVSNADDMRWLEALVWPEHEERRSRLRSAIEFARTDPPALVKGNLLGTLQETAASAPRDATLVVFHSAVLTYLSADERSMFTHTVQQLPGHWISNEGAAVIQFPPGSLPERSDSSTSVFVVALDGKPLAYAGPHGQWLDWFGQSPSEGAVAG